MRVFRPYKNIVSTTGRFLIGVILFIFTANVLLVSFVNAAEYPKLPNRSLDITDVSPSAVTDYTISFRYPAPTTIGSILFQLCTTTVIGDPCINPGGDLSAAILNSQSGITGFSVNSQTANEILITRTPAAASTVQSTYQFTNITNPSTVQKSLYIRILTYPTSDGSGNFNHASSVVSAITTPIVIYTEVPPILYFCAGIVISDYCSTVTGNYIDYGTLNSASVNFGTSQFGAATNAVGGYVVTINGNTMTSGNKTIDALNTPTASAPGTPQFGLNLRANTDPATGQDTIGPGVGVVNGNYNTPDFYQFVDGDTVATAATGTLFNTFTVTYIVNVPPTQDAGVYNTTIGYICTAAF